MRVEKGGVRLTGGTARGAKLFAVPGLDVRPALARMRVSVFEILRSALQDAVVADVFAGTGSLGLESLSRGARRAVFLDTDPRCLQAIRRNLEKLRFSDRADVREADAFRGAEGLEPADVAFVDPPYAYYEKRAPEMRTLVEVLLARVVTRSEGRVVVEHRTSKGLGPVTGGQIVDERRYGGTEVTFYSAGN